MSNLEQIKLVEASLFIAGRPIKTDDLLTLIDGKGKEELIRSGAKPLLNTPYKMIYSHDTKVVE